MVIETVEPGPSHSHCDGRLSNDWGQHPSAPAQEGRRQRITAAATATIIINPQERQKPSYDDSVTPLGRAAPCAWGYQLFGSMPTSTQMAFPLAGHRLYTADYDVTALLREAGFEHVGVFARGPHRLQLGRLS